MKECFILKGNICQTKTKDELDLHENSYVVCEKGISKGIFKEIPEQYKHFEVLDCGG